jgi:hypothetical protein
VAAGKKWASPARVEGTGGLIAKELDALSELDERLKAEGRPNDVISMNRAVAMDHFRDVQLVVHGGSPVIANQRAITKFLYSSRAARIEAGDD